MNNDFRSVVLSLIEDYNPKGVLQQICEDVVEGTFVDLCMYDLSEEVLDEASSNYSDARMVQEKYGKGVSVKLGDVEYRYISDEYSTEDLLKKLQGIMRHQGTGQIKKWLDRHTMKYWDSKNGDVKTGKEEKPKKSLETKDSMEGGKFTLVINGKKYQYESDDYTAKEIQAEYQKRAKHNRGMAISWLKKNCKPATRINESGFTEIVDPEEELNDSISEGSLIKVNGEELLVEEVSGTDIYVVSSEDKRYVVNLYEAFDITVEE